MTEPRTEAGRRLLNDVGRPSVAHILDAILAIEAEATELAHLRHADIEAAVSVLDVERLARALEATSKHVGPMETVTFARFAKIVAAEYAADHDERDAEAEREFLRPIR
jgi:sulfite reductase beta subunit-like hemoprotein